MNILIEKLNKLSSQIWDKVFEGDNMEFHKKNEWTESEDNLFSANHRNLMFQHHKGTMAEIYTIEDFEKEFKKRKL